MELKEKVKRITLNTLPIVVMILLIPLILNDSVLTLIYIFIIAAAFILDYRKNEHLIFIFGFFVMIASKSFFITTGVETFQRNSLFGLMPLWLPFLWAYGFVAIKRGIVVLGK